MPININQQIITSAFKKLTILTFFINFRTRAFGKVYAYLLFQSAVVFTAQDLIKKILIGCHLFVLDYHVWLSWLFLIIQHRACVKNSNWITFVCWKSLCIKIWKKAPDSENTPWKHQKTKGLGIFFNFWTQN